MDQGQHDAPPPIAWGSDALRDIATERRRQIEVEGWTPEHDDEHKGGGMAFAAACYAVMAAGHAKTSFFVVSLWKWTGWSNDWLKPKNPRADLVRAGALIVAEIERLDRAA